MTLVSGLSGFGGPMPSANPICLRTQYLPGKRFSSPQTRTPTPWRRTSDGSIRRSMRAMYLKRQGLIVMVLPLPGFMGLSLVLQSNIIGDGYPSILFLI